MNLDVLRERARIVRAIRQFFDERDFLEVETAVRIPAPAPEEHIDCPPVEGGGYLRASPELQMKKLIAAGLDRIYQIGPCFREGERGSRHNPEFTMIEWYRRNATYLDIMEDLEGMFERFGGFGKFGRFGRLKVREAYLKFAGWDPWVGDWDQDRFDFDMATKIEPALKEMGGGVFLMDYPPQAASLAKLSTPVPCSPFPVPCSPFPAPCSPFPVPSSPSPVPCSPSPVPCSPFPVPCSLSHAERWEFYYDGMELANCFTELCDQEEQTRRFMLAKEARKRLKEADYPIDTEFLSVLPQMQSAAGVALGVDRLVMVLTHTREISAVRAEI